MQKQAARNPSLWTLYEQLSPEPLLIGLTGGIAAGKSLVSSFFKKKRLPVIDADRIAHEVIRPGRPAYQKIIEVFGSGLLTHRQQINRKQLGAIVFQDAQKRELLESIAHPEILKEILSQIEKFKKQKPRMIVVDAALLFESGLYRKMDKKILVTCHPSVQLKRLMKRDKLSKVEAWTRILSQMPTAEKKQFADYLIDNSSTPSVTRKRTEAIFQKLLS